MLTGRKILYALLCLAGACQFDTRAIPQEQSSSMEAQKASDAGAVSAADGGEGKHRNRTELRTDSGVMAAKPPTVVSPSPSSNPSPNPGMDNPPDASVRVCKDAAAAESCNERDDDCDGITDEGFSLKSDPKHCGTCSTSCERGDACCDGECINTTTDADHCGACGRPCPSGERCKAGVCMTGGAGASGPQPPTGGAGGPRDDRCVPACSEGQTCCDGACVDLKSDAMHCNACGRACKGEQPGCCDGKCVDLLSDTTCGSCSRDCSLLGNGSITCECVRDASGKIGCTGPVLNLCL